MNIRNVSIVVFYRGDGKILIQDRRNIDKDDIEWGFFGGGWEVWETAEMAAIREIKEELNIPLFPDDLKKIGLTIREVIDISRLEIHVFVTQWKPEYADILSVREWAGYDWISPKDMRNLHIYSIDYPNIDILEQYFSTLHA